MVRDIPVDIVDRRTPAPLRGATWSAQADAFLDELNRRDRDRQDALDALTRLTIRRPELEADTDLCQARMALLR